MDVLGMDLEQYRLAEKLTYDQLAVRIGIPQGRQAQAYALGEQQPGTERLEEILRATGGKVSVFAMHKRRLDWLRNNGKIRRIDVLNVPAKSRSTVATRSAHS